MRALVDWPKRSRSLERMLDDDLALVDAGLLSEHQHARNRSAIDRCHGSGVTLPTPGPRVLEPERLPDHGVVVDPLQRSLGRPLDQDVEIVWTAQARLGFEDVQIWIGTTPCAAARSSLGSQLTSAPSSRPNHSAMGSLGASGSSTNR